MAEKPARTIPKDLSTQGLEPGSPEYQHKIKLIEEEEQRKKSTKVADQWIEHHVDNNHDKGGKVVLKKRVTRTEGGKVVSAATHSLYLGRYKKGGKEMIAKYKEKGVELRQPRLN